ncbi:MAG: MmgE/PrpD family protein [Acidobacteria bacterium]|nr:MAG: MmgE/PrpD family protein [Acidobacteriota bacterium]
MADELSRRDLLKSTGAFALIGAALPAAAGAGFSQRETRVVPEVMSALSTYMSQAATRELPREVTEKTKHIILDTLAAMISGSELPPGKFAIQFARGYKGDKMATVAASNVLCGAMEAALANGMLAHSDETDDTHSFSQSHPGCSVVPAALAAGEQFGIEGIHLMRAVALGYDIGTRVTITLGRLPYMAETHRSTHAICGTFGSAAAAGCAANLNAQQMRWLLSYTAQQASGLASWQRDTDHIEKAFDFAGMPARNGVTAALLVRAGGTGVNDVFSGADNFFEAFLPKNDPSLISEKLGERYEVTRTSFKKWTTGSPIQAVLDALVNLQKRNAFTPDDVKQVLVRVATNEAAIVNNREIPDISLQHLVAVMLLDKTVSFKSAHDIARMKDPAVLRQRAKVQLIPDEELERRMPRREAIVEIVLANGTRLTEHVDAVRGTFDNPMPREEVVAKARDLITPVLGAPTCTKLIDAVLALENVKNIRELRPLLQRNL